MREIEVVEVNIVEGGVEVYARVFENGEQIGFGVDGSVDIERFRVINPPVLVSDENGDIVREGIFIDDDGNSLVKTRTLREDPEEAILRMIDRVINSIPNKHDGSNIIPGKRGKTVTPILSDTGDGTVGDFNASWATLHADTNGSQVDDSASTGADRGAGSYFSGSTYKIYRAFFSFDTSAIGSDTINSATFILYARDSTNSAGTQDYVMVEGTQASTSSLTGTDMDNVGSTAFSNAVTIADSTQQDRTFTLNASGLSHINGSGTTKFAVLTNSLDFANVTPNDGSQETNGLWSYSDYTGTDQDPVLTIDHTAAAGATFIPKVMMVA